MAKVIAVAPGYYNGRYIVKGETFDYPDGERIRNWMVKAEEYKAPKPKPPRKEPRSLSELARMRSGDASQEFPV